MKKALLFLFLFASSLASGQTSKFRFGLALNAGRTDNIQSNDGSVPNVVSNAYKDLEQRSIGYSGQIFTQYSTSSKFKLQVGMGYVRTEYATEIKELVFAQPEPNMPRYSKFEYSHQDLMLPIQARYNFSVKKNTFYVLGGISPLFKLKRSKTNTLWYADGSISSKTDDDSVTDYRTLNFNGSFGIGYDLKVAKKMNVFFQPTFDCNLLGASKSASLNRRVYSVGLSVGFIYG